MKKYYGMDVRRGTHGPLTEAIVYLGEHKNLEEATNEAQTKNIERIWDETELRKFNEGIELAVKVFRLAEGRDIYFGEDDEGYLHSLGDMELISDAKEASEELGEEIVHIYSAESLVNLQEEIKKALKA